MNTAAPRVFAFSPLTIEACYAQMFDYALERFDAGADDNHADKPAPSSRSRIQCANALDGKMLQSVAGGVEKLAAIRRMLEGTGITVPENLGKDSLIAASKLKFEFSWPSDSRMEIPQKDTGSGYFMLRGSSETFVAKVFRDVPDTLGVYVNRAKGGLVVSVLFVALPDMLPSDVRQGMTKEDLRRWLMRTHADLIHKKQHNPLDVQLGVAYMLDFEASTIMSLPEILLLTLPGGRSIDEAVHACEFGMDKVGGFVHAGTLMISKGISFGAELDFRKFVNGYLVFVEITRATPYRDTNPACIAAAWVNMPFDVADD